MTLKIEYVKKDSLKPYVNNAKIHTPQHIEQIKNSIREFGFNDPIAVWHGDEIIEGHGRLLAVMEMDDIQEVPIIRLDNLTDKKRKAYMLVHNKLTMNTGFDFDVLDEELTEISGDFDLESFGFDLSEMPDLSEFQLEEENEPKEHEPKMIKCPHCGKEFEA